MSTPDSNAGEFLLFSLLSEPLTLSETSTLLYPENGWSPENPNSSLNLLLLKPTFLLCAHDVLAFIGIIMCLTCGDNMR